MIRPLGPVPALPGLPITPAPPVPQTLMPGFLDASGDITGLGICAVWLLTSLIALPAALALSRLRPSAAPHRAGLICLAALWPLPLAALLVSIPFLLIRTGLLLMFRTTPAWLPIVEGCVETIRWARQQYCRRCERRRALRRRDYYLHSSSWAHRDQERSR